MTPNQASVEVHLTAEAVARAARNRNGLTYKGFGLLSGNATSSMLMDYKARHPEVYWKLVETLFAGPRPLMNTVKVEMGNDRNNSTGPNAATMRERDEYPAVTREPGFQLAADARRYQPGVHLSILRWMAPTWVHDNDDVYRWYKNTILAVWREYGVMVDSVNPDVNERKADLEWIAEFAHRVRTDETGFEGNGPDDPNAGWSSDEERELFHRIKVITSDEEVTGTFGPELLASSELLDAVDVAAYHYSVVDDETGSFKRLADEVDKEIWNSEAQATFSNSADRPNNTNDWGLDETAGTSGTASLPLDSSVSDDGVAAGTEAGGQNGLPSAGVGTGLGGQNGPLEMANTLIKGFVCSRRTHAIYQPAIGACHEHMEYASKELISARDPWSGWIYYDAGCAILEHFAKFATLGWAPSSHPCPLCEGAVAQRATGGETLGKDETPDPIWRAIPSASACEVGGNNPVNGARHGEPSYLTLAAPDGSDASTVIVNDSALPRTYHLTLDPALPAAAKPLHIWETRAAETGSRYDANYRRHIGDATPGEPIVVRPWSIVTVTTLADVEPYAIPATGENTRAVLDTDPEAGVLYADDFTYADEAPVEVFRRDALAAAPYLASRGGDAGATPRYTTDSNGAFEIVPDPDRGHVLRQQIDWTHAGNAWIEGDPRTAIGETRWANYRVSVDVRFEDYPGRAPYVLLGAHEMGGDKFTTDICAADIKLRADGVWLLRRYGEEKVRGHYEDLRRAAEAAGKPVFPKGAGTWFTLALEVAGPRVSAWVNGAKIAEWTDPAPQALGRINLGTSFDHVRFSNLRVERVEGLSPYATALVDDMHMVSWDDTATPVLQYDGQWSHRNGQGMFVYMRSLSETSQPGASVTHRFHGTGLAVFGPSDGTARLDVLVDGELAEAAKPVAPTNGALRTQLIVGPLPQGDHTVTLRLANPSTWQLDALAPLA